MAVRPPRHRVVQVDGMRPKVGRQRVVFGIVAARGRQRATAAKVFDESPGGIVSERRAAVVNVLPKRNRHARVPRERVVAIEGEAHLRAVGIVRRRTCLGHSV